MGQGSASLMKGESAVLDPVLVRRLRSREPLLWLNPNRRPMDEARVGMPLCLADIERAEDLLRRSAGLLAHLFPEVAPSGGLIESPLIAVPRLRDAMFIAPQRAGRWLVKADHALPIAGSIKARGGIYEVLVHAERLATDNGLLHQTADPTSLASPRARSLFGRHRIATGSTGNLGLSIGVIAAALGFKATVHMSSDAKSWKKERLRASGVEVVEHTGEAAVATGRAQALQDPRTYFVDDENSKHLFLGYGVAALRLPRQLAEQGIEVDSTHPLFVYIPCGVGGAPGGITFGLRQVFGDNVHCFFAEPVASPSMLIALAAHAGDLPSVRDIGLDNLTQADGLAVSRASRLAAALMRTLASGVFTVPDDDLFCDLYRLEQTEGIRVEPSAAAGFRGPQWLLDSSAGSKYLELHDALPYVREATHVLWSTGGSLAPEPEYRRWHERGRRLAGVLRDESHGQRIQ